MNLATFSRRVHDMISMLGPNAKVKFIVIGPDDKKPIELKYVQSMDGGDGSIVLQLEAK